MLQGDKADMTDILIRASIERSIEDVISMLDASPIEWDMVSYLNAVQIGNRAQNAHLVLERGLKTLIRFAGGEVPREHSLARLFRRLGQVDPDTAEFLESAFSDAVEFYGFDARVSDHRHLGNINTYFGRTGSNGAFQTYRYWVTDFIDDQEVAMPPISLEVHRELLCAIARLIGLDDKQTVSKRVDWAVFHALSPGGPAHNLWYSDGESEEETIRRNNVESYLGWFNSAWHNLEQRPWREVLREAATSGFQVDDNRFVGETVRAAHKELTESTDPAVRHYLRRFGYLPVGSQPRVRDLAPMVEWFYEGRHGAVKTPEGEVLGYIHQHADGGWGIDPGSRALKREIAEAQPDAVWYLVNRHTREIEVATENLSRTLRLVQDDDWFVQRPKSSGNVEDAFQPASFELRFWDATHGLTVGETINAKLAGRDNRAWVSMLEGKISSVDRHGVIVIGNSWFDVADPSRTP